MSNPTHPFTELLERDKRYRLDAYVFVFEALRYAQEVLGLGTEEAADTSEDAADDQEKDEQPADEPAADDSVAGDEGDRDERHLTGQELCEAIRLYALEQYGYMAKSVLNHWGVQSTKDFGEIVFNLIEIGQMRKTSGDRREDFKEVFEFEKGFHRDFEITLPD
jgi:uncharacterized repeat protein (TIGR04138 family)